MFAAKYDGLGRRIEKSTGTAVSRTARYVYDNEDIVAMLDGDNAMTAVFSHGPGIDEPLMMRKADGAEFSCTRMGSARLLPTRTTWDSRRKGFVTGHMGCRFFWMFGGQSSARDDSFTESPCLSPPGSAIESSCCTTTGRGTGILQLEVFFPGAQWLDKI